MDDCPICFKSRLPLLPSFWPDALDWTYADPLLTIQLTFAEDMDQAPEPLPAEFVLDVDDVFKTPTTFIWDNTTQCTITYSEAVLNPTVVSIRYQTSSSRFLSVLAEHVTPFDLPVAAP